LKEAFIYAKTVCLLLQTVQGTGNMPVLELLGGRFDYPDGIATADTAMSAYTTSA
jgi:hypothetical protein